MENILEEADRKLIPAWLPVGEVKHAFPRTGTLYFVKALCGAGPGVLEDRRDLHACSECVSLHLADLPAAWAALNDEEVKALQERAQPFIERVQPGGRVEWIGRYTALVRDRADESDKP